MRWREKLGGVVLALLLLVFALLFALWLLRPLWTLLPSEAPGPVVTAHISSMKPGDRMMAHTLRIIVRDEGGRIGMFNVPARLNTCQIGDPVAVRRIGIKVAVEPGQCRRPE